MAYADRAGRARVDARNPRGFAVCDGCGEWYNRMNLMAQYDWAGDAMIDLGYRYCRRCLSKPQEQLRTVILPLDPVPIDDPRPEFPDINQNLNNFQQIVGPRGTFLHVPVAAEFDPTAPMKTKNALLIALFNGGLPVPVLTADDGTIYLTDDAGNILFQDGVNDISGQIAISGVGLRLANPNTLRNYLLIYNPAAPVLGTAQGQPILGGTGTVIIGTGSAIIQSAPSTSVAGTVWQSAVYALGLIAGAPFWAWEGIGVTVRP